MNDTSPKLPPAAMLEPTTIAGLGVSKGELVVLPPSLDQLAALIRQGHREVEAHTVHAVLKAVETGKALLQAKPLVGHGNFEDYVAVQCRFSMTTAQNYMKLARKEAEVRQRLEAKTKDSGYLTLSEALKFIGTLSNKNRRKKRRKASI